MNKTVLSFGLLIAALLILFQLGKYRYVQGDVTMEVIVSVIAIVFFFIGLYFRNKWMKKEDGEKVNMSINHEKINELGLSRREQEVLQEITNGLSNKEIADKLFVSESTIKTHVSNIYNKLGVNKRPQAIKVSQEWRLVNLEN